MTSNRWISKISKSQPKLISPEFIAVRHGFGAAISWGTGDFSGGLATKTTDVYSVLLVANSIGLGILASVAFWLGHLVPGWYPPLMGAAAGIFSCFFVFTFDYFLGLHRMHQKKSSFYQLLPCWIWRRL